jgi:hypothetical protein
MPDDYLQSLHWHMNVWSVKIIFHAHNLMILLQALLAVCDQVGRILQGHQVEHVMAVLLEGGVLSLVGELNFHPSALVAEHALELRVDVYSQISTANPEIIQLEYS